MILRLPSACRLSLILGLLLLTATYAHPASPTVAITPKPQWVVTPAHELKKTSARNATNGFVYSLIEEQIHVEKKTNYSHVVREIVTEAGIQGGSDISLKFDPQYENVEFHQLTVWRDNKPLNRLTRRVFKVVASESDLESHLHYGKYTVLLLLDDIRKGDQIEYSYSIKGANPIFNNKFSHELYLQDYNPIAHFYVSLLASKSRLLHFKTFASAKKPKLTDHEGLNRYEWESFNVQPPAQEDYQPGWFNNFSRVQISEYSNWGEVIKWGMDVNPIPSQLTGDLLDRVNRLKKQTGHQKGRYFREAVRIVQDEIRYLGMEMGRRSHKASAPELVYKQRYGDCKDKSVLLAAILHAGGIPARLALINTSYQDEIFNQLPSPISFNHMVVVATIQNQDVWVDPTISNQGGEGRDLAFPDYKAALVLQKGYNRLVNIPVTAHGRTKCTERYYVVDENARVRLDVETVYSRDQADLVRGQLASLSLEKVSTANLDYYSKIYPAIEPRDSLVVNDDRKANTITITESYMINNFFQLDSATKKYNVSFYGNFIKEQLPSINPNRKNPVSLNYPFDMDYDIVIVMNSPLNIAAENFSIDRDSYHFQRRVGVSGRTLSINLQFAFKKNYVTTEKVGEFANDVRAISDSHLSYSVSYQPGIDSEAIRINYPFIVLAVVMVIFLFVFAIRVYRQETVPLDEYVAGQGRSLGGWLILVLIGLSLTPFRVIPFLYEHNYFSLNLWEVVPPNGNTLLFKVMIVFELVFNILIAFYSVFCVFLIVKKRDILPKWIIGFYAVSVGGLVIDTYASSYIFVDTEGAWKELLRSVVPAAIWVPYFLKSQRVNETFVVPYPAVKVGGEEHYEEAEYANLDSKPGNVNKDGQPDL